MASPEYEFEDILNIVGSFGRWQMSVIFISTLSGFLCAFNHFGVIFLAYPPDEYFCMDEGKSNKSCYYNNGTSCSKWGYDDKIMKSTVVTDFNLVCESRIYQPIIQSSYMTGVVIAAMFGGVLSDHFGRRKVLLVASVIHCITSFAVSFSKSYLAFVGLRIFVGGSAHVMWSCLFILLAESISFQKWMITGLHMNLSWYIGSILMTGICYGLRDWRNIQTVFASISLLALAHFWICESPRWLIRKKRFEEANIALKNIAKINGVDLNRSEYRRAFEELSKVEGERDVSTRETLFESIFDCAKGVLPILSQLEVLKRFGLLMIPFFVIGTASYGIHFSVRLIPFGIFTVTILKSVASVATGVIVYLIFTKIPRTLLLFLCFAVTGLLGILYIFLTSDILKIVLYIILQSLANASYYFLDIYTPKVFPTRVRNQAFSFLDCWSKVGTTLSTFIVDFGTDVHPDFPFVMFGLILLLSSFVFFFLPETKNKTVIDQESDLKERMNEQENRYQNVQN